MKKDEIISTTIEFARLAIQQDQQFSLDNCGARGFAEFLLYTKYALEVMEQGKPVKEAIDELYATLQRDCKPLPEITQEE